MMVMRGNSSNTRGAGPRRGGPGGGGADLEKIAGITVHRGRSPIVRQGPVHLAVGPRHDHRVAGFQFSDPGEPLAATGRLKDRFQRRQHLGQGGALAAALGGWWYQSSQVALVRQELVQAQQKMDQFHGQMQSSVSAAKTEVNETIAKMNEQLEQARRD